MSEEVQLQPTINHLPSIYDLPQDPDGPVVYRC